MVNCLKALIFILLGIMAASNSVNADESGVQTYNITNGNWTGSPTTQYIVQLGDTNNKITGVSGTGTAAQVLTSNGAGVAPTWQDNSGGFAPNSVIHMKDDFACIVGTGSNTFVSELGWFANGTVDSSQITFSTSSHPGTFTNTAFSTSPSIFSVAPGPGGGGGGCCFVLGGGAIQINWVFNTGIASDGTNRYNLYIGMGVVGASEPTDGVYFAYSDNVNSGNWVIKTSASSSRTSTNTSTAFAAGWHNFQITINAAATSINYTLDGVSLGNITTNIPTAQIQPFFNCVRSSGTIPAHTLAVDLFYLTQTLTTPR